MRSIAIIGGTGPQGRGLGYRFAKGGHDVLLGSRVAERSVETAKDLEERVGGKGSVSGVTNAQAVDEADIVLLAVPFDGHDELVTGLAPQLAGKVVISCVNPLGFDKLGPYGRDIGPTSAAETAQRLAPESRVVGAFHHVSAVALNGAEEYLDHEDILVCGDDADAKSTVMELALTVTGKPGIDVGALRLARQLEPLTAVILSINKRHKVRSAGIAVVGLPR
jgi:NADPH-dependent F420 reductase